MSAKTKSGNFTSDVVNALKVTSEDIIVNGRIVSISSENTVADASQIWDSEQGHNQEYLNDWLKQHYEKLLNRISSISKFDIKVVNSLPTSGISGGTIYLVKSSDDEQNMYAEYIYVNNEWEKLGEQPYFEDMSDEINSLKSKLHKKYEIYSFSTSSADGYGTWDLVGDNITLNIGDTIDQDGHDGIVLRGRLLFEDAAIVAFFSGSRSADGVNEAQFYYFVKATDQSVDGCTTYNVYGPTTIDFSKLLTALGGEENKYDDLVRMRKYNSLTPGAKYILTDYTFVPSTNNWPDTMKCGDGSFYIVLTADTTNSFKREVSFLHNPNDTYFKDQKLNAWEGWYSLDNDESLYPWSSSESKGVIYRLIDENGNDFPYDFKHVMFKLDDATLWRKVSSATRTLRQGLEMIAEKNGATMPTDLEYVYSIIYFPYPQKDASLILKNGGDAFCTNNKVVPARPGYAAYGSTTGRFLRNVLVNASCTTISSVSYGNVVCGVNNDINLCTGCVVLDGYNCVKQCTHCIVRYKCDCLNGQYWDGSNAACAKIHNLLLKSAAVNNLPILPVMEIPTWGSSLHVSQIIYCDGTTSPNIKCVWLSDFLTEHQSLTEYAKTSDVPTKTSQLTNDSGFLTSHQSLGGKQDKLTAGDNITINNNVISATLPEATTSKLGGVKVNKTADDYIEAMLDSVGVTEVNTYVENGVIYGYIPNATTELSGAMSLIDKISLEDIKTYGVESPDESILKMELVTELPPSVDATTAYFIPE